MVNELKNDSIEFELIMNGSNLFHSMSFSVQQFDIIELKCPILYTLSTLSIV